MTVQRAPADKFKTLYKAFQVTAKGPRRLAQTKECCDDCLRRFGVPDHVIYGSPDLASVFEQVFPDAVLVFDTRYEELYSVGYPDANKTLVDIGTLNALISDAAIVDSIDPNDDLKRYKPGFKSRKKAKPTLSSLPGYDDLAKEVEDLIAATPDLNGEAPF